MIWGLLSASVYVMVEPMEIYERYYIIPLILAAVTAIFPAFLESRIEKLQEELERAKKSREHRSNTTKVQTPHSKRDSLTKALRKDAFNEIIGIKIIEAKHVDQPLSIIIFDIDHFKKINDTYGHLVGDTVLQQVSEVVRSNIRESEYFVRWGGEEFIILLPGTGLQGAQMVAEKIRRAIEAKEFDTVGKVTCSFGVTQLLSDDTISSFIERADEALYEAKHGGRNQVRTKL